jgi:hypothetical protein
MLLTAIAIPVLLVFIHASLHMNGLNAAKQAHLEKTVMGKVLGTMGVGEHAK